MSNEPLSSNELNSELTGLNKGEKNNKTKTKIITAIILSSILLIILVLIIVFHSLETITSYDGISDDKPALPVIGEINCVYEVRTSTKTTLLLGNDFKKVSDLDFEIFVEGKKIKYTKEYQFDSIGNHNVQFKIYKNLNMDNMFKGVRDLMSVEMKSEKDYQ